MVHQYISVMPIHTTMPRRRGVMHPEESEYDKRVAIKPTEELKSFNSIALARSPTNRSRLIPFDALPTSMQAVDLLGGHNYAAHVQRHAASSRLPSLVRNC